MRHILIALLLLAALPVQAEDAIGRVNIAGYNRRGMCTGTLVAPAVVLTAAHCVLNRDGSRKPIRDMVFVAGWDGTRHAAAAEVAGIRLHPMARSGRHIDAAHDLALLELAEALDIAPLDLGSAAPAGPFALSGYTRQRPYRTTDSDGCAGTPRGAIWHLDCPVDYGQSGGPVLAGEDGARRVVAVVSARDDGGTLVVPVDAWVGSEVARPYTPPDG